MSRLPIVLLLLLVSGLAPIEPLRAASVGVRLQDPRDGRDVVVEPQARVLHLVFFATWCPRCVEQLPELAEMKARWGDRDYRQVIVAVGTRQSAERLARFFEGRTLSAELVFDADGEAERLWSAGHVPMHLVLDATGRELARGPATKGAVESAVAETLSRRRRTGRQP